MSLEFKRKRSHSTKWSKKYPRARINNKGGDRKAAIAAGWYKFNWNDDHFNMFNGKHIIKFLKANIGRPIDKVFSEFLNKCNNKLRKSYPLKEEFFSYIEKKEDIDYLGGFYVSNGILNYKEPCSKEEYRKKIAQLYHKPLQDCIDYNLSHIPPREEIIRICREATNTKKPQLLGKLYVHFKYTNQLRNVYVMDSDYPDFLYAPCEINRGTYYPTSCISIVLDYVCYGTKFSDLKYKLVTKTKRETFKK